MFPRSSWKEKIKPMATVERNQSREIGGRETCALLAFKVGEKERESPSWMSKAKTP